MPPYLIERETVQRIADEFTKLGEALRSYPQGPADARSSAPSKAILTSLQTINGTIGDGARDRRLGPSRYATLGREFSKIGATLSSLGSPTKSTARKAVKRTTTRTATKRTATKRKRTR